jgi:hypothetical protein
MLISSLISCKKLVEVNTPVNQLTTNVVFSDSTTAKSALLDIYALYANTVDGIFNPPISLYSDELGFSNTSVQTVEFLQSSVSSTNTSDLNIWTNFYAIIYSCNDLINQLSNTNKLSSGIVKQYVSEAKFLRAYAYFYLTNLYGNVPLALTTDVSTTSTIARADSATIYKQIIQDLSDAQNGLSANYADGGKVRVNKLATTAFLGRIYLYQKNWVDAENAASTVINSGLYTPLDAPANIFLAGSTETILQFWTPTGFVRSGAAFIPRSGKPTYSLSTNLINAFEAGDLRKSNWTKSNVVGGIAYFYPYKYHNRTDNTAAPEYLMVLRLAEQYLIRAEARAMLNNFTGAQYDLNIVRKRAGLPNSVANDQSSLLTAIGHERQVELFTEWGHRLFDLKRTNQANSILGANKTTWKKDISLVLPIPQYELDHDPNLSQNTGY